MALHLNLYHEVQKAKQLQRRDPLKLSIYGLSAIAAAFAGYYFFELSRLQGVTDEFAKVQAEFGAVEQVAKEAKKRDDEL
ncbi:MAG: Fimbrial assembly family protein, partial [Chthoniobacter sp.]|nr:Fimbrial assembly family protein [Chthoniobacter sp.]